MGKEKFLGIVCANYGGYRVFLVPRIEGKKSYVGVTDYEEKTIKIEEGFVSEMLQTLRHELMHIWLYEHGYKEQNGGCFSFEEVCELAASASGFIDSNINSFCFRYL